jgi:hypothetical protein
VTGRVKAAHKPGNDLYRKAARRELADQLERARRRGVQVSGELGDLIAEAIELGDARVCGDDGECGGLHEGSSHAGNTCWGHSIPRS